MQKYKNIILENYDSYVKLRLKHFIDIGLKANKSICSLK